MNIDIKHLQACELIIAEEIKRICEKHSIKYFLLAGSMLGAIRHKGFIPWDDDMDFGMLRSDYEQFCEVCQDDLNPQFELVNWNTDANYPFSYGKIVLKKTHIKERFAPEMKRNDGIFVDIFPFDRVPMRDIDQERQKRKLYLYRRILWVKKGYGRCIVKQGLKQRIKYDGSRIVFSILPYKSIKRKLFETQTRYNGDESDFVVMDSPYSYQKSMMRKEWLNHICYYDFDGHKFPGICDYDAYLKNIYGDYMKLPPEDKRCGHEITEVEFNNY